MDSIDFRKAYDNVTLSQITETLKMFMQHITLTMTGWKISLFFNNKFFGLYCHEMNIFVGYILSHYCCHCFNPSQWFQDQVGFGFKFQGKDPELNHLLFMDNLKFFAKSENETDWRVQTVRVCSRGIRMQFGISKCAVVKLLRGKRETFTSIELLDRNKIFDPDENK